MKLLPTVATLGLLLGSITSAQAADGYLTVEQARDSLERLAGKTPYLAHEPVIFDRPQHWFRVANPDHQKAVPKVRAPEHGSRTSEF